MQPYVTTSGLLSLFAPPVVSIAFAVWARLVQERRKGWNHVTPGLSYWLPLLLGLGLACLVVWVWAFVGSSRSDAAFQMRVAWWLALAFGLMACWCGWRIFALERQAIRWRGTKVEWRRAGHRHERSLVGATNIMNGWSGTALVCFQNGDRILLDTAAHNSSELIARIEELNGLADPDGPPEH